MLGVDVTGYEGLHRVGVAVGVVREEVRGEELLTRQPGEAPRQGERRLDGAAADRGSGPLKAETAALVG